MDVITYREPRGCNDCAETGYRGRQPLVEMLTLDAQPTAEAVLQREGSGEIESRAIAAGMRSRWQQAADAIVAGTTSPEEIRRVLGFRQRSG
jgi:type II secretory ATPase GspE/PulE/Tfp pilus assembly ATPase PilB-like protein